MKDGETPLAFMVLEPLNPVIAPRHGPPVHSRLQINIEQPHWLLAFETMT